MMHKKSFMTRTVTIAAAAVLLLAFRTPLLAEEDLYILLLPNSSEVEYNVDADHYSEEYSKKKYMILLYGVGEEVDFQITTDAAYLLEDAATEEVFNDYSVSEDGWVSFSMPGTDLCLVLEDDNGQENGGETAGENDATSEEASDTEQAGQEDAMVTVGASVVPASPDETVRRGNDFTFQVELQEGYSRTDDFAVKANGEVLTENEDGSYTISNISDNQIITVEGVADITAPNMEIFLNDEASPVQAEEDSYSFLESVVVRIEASDTGSGVSAIQYALSSEPVSETEEITGWKDYTEEITVEDPGEQILYSKAVDREGNETVQATAIFIGRVQEAPVVFATAETIAGKADGHISGLDTTMEYSTDGENYTEVTDPSMEFPAGTYEVRYAAKDEYMIPEPAEVTIEKGRELSVVFMADNEIVDIVEVDYGGSIPEDSIPDVPQKEEYDWMDGYWDVDSLENITDDMIVQAEYQEVEFTISFSTYLTDNETSAPDEGEADAETKGAETAAAEEGEEETEETIEAEEKEESAEAEDTKADAAAGGDYEFSIILFGGITAEVELADGTVEHADQDNALTLTDTVEEVVISSAVNPEILLSLDGVELSEEDGAYKRSADQDGNIFLTFDEEKAADGTYVLIISE